MWTRLTITFHAAQQRRHNNAAVQFNLSFSESRGDLSANIILICYNFSLIFELCRVSKNEITAVFTLRPRSAFWCRETGSAAYVNITSRSQWTRGLRPAAALLQGFGFDSHPGNGCLYLACVVCCQVEFSASGRSLVQRSPTVYGVSECDREALIMWKPRPTRCCCSMVKRGKLQSQRNIIHRLPCSKELIPLIFPKSRTMLHWRLADFTLKLYETVARNLSYSYKCG